MGQQGSLGKQAGVMWGPPPCFHAIPPNEFPTYSQLGTGERVKGFLEIISPISQFKRKDLFLPPPKVC